MVITYRVEMFIYSIHQITYKVEIYKNFRVDIKSSLKTSIWEHLFSDSIESKSYTLLTNKDGSSFF